MQQIVARPEPATEKWRDGAPPPRFDSGEEMAKISSGAPRGLCTEALYAGALAGRWDRGEDLTELCIDEVRDQLMNGFAPTATCGCFRCRGDTGGLSLCRPASLARN